MAAAKVLGGVLLKQQAESGPSVAALASELVAENREAALTTGPTVNVGAGLKLLDAAQAGDVGFAQQLLRMGASPDQEEHGFTPLILAAREGKLDVLKLLLERGAKVQPDDATAQADTALIAAVESGSDRARLDAVGEAYAAIALAAGEDDSVCKKAADDATDRWRKQQNSIMSALLDANADPNRRDSGGWTALMYAAHGGNNLAARVLLRHGAEPDARTPTGRSPLMLAADVGARGIVKLLLDRAREGQGDVELDAQDEDGQTALMAAAENNDVECMELLLAPRDHGVPGANIDLQAKSESTALMAACQEKADDAARFLVEHGASLDLQRETKANALSTSFIHGESKGGKEVVLAAYLRIRGASDPRKPPKGENEEDKGA